MGLSLLGHPCDRWIWLNFRWAVTENFSGRMLRLFRRGHREEETIVRDLRAAGVVIRSTDADEDGQCRVDFGCHVSGSVDGIIESGVPGAEKTRHVAEFKTHSLKSFRELQSKGVYEAKRRHWWQMQGYMLGTKIDRALYIAVCKDNDEMYAERVYLDKPKAESLIRRGHGLALAERIPEPLSADPSWWQCKLCAAHDFCFTTHLSEEVNCRTCAHVTPTKEGTWICSHGTPYELTVDEQRAGCDCHTAHPDLVPWKFRGGTENGFCARYEIKGREYLNGSPYLTDCALTTHELLIIDKQGEKDEEVPF
ncbi:hypothetical protein B5F39_10535 [Cloacibacillus sp. An23]|nr:hypothetical protein B5F39_10535 [Cloacibacillus sp. An23]